MASLRDIKRRIISVKNTQKITRAMKMVAASKLRRAQEALGKARPYAHRMRDLVNSLAQCAQTDAHPLLRQATGDGKIGLVVVTSDRGLCGAFNSNIVNAAMKAIGEEFQGREVEITAVGRKGVELLKRRPCTIRETHISIDEGPIIDAAGVIIKDIAQDFAQGPTDQVYCLYNEFKSAISQKVTLERLLPFEPPSTDEPGTIDYLYEPSEAAVFDALLSRHMQIQMHCMLQESAASEHGARMTAMESATKNAGEVIEHLELVYNRARQGAITTELIEVVSGAEAL